MKRFESEEIYDEHRFISKRIGELKRTYEGDLDKLETECFNQAIKAYEKFQETLVKIDEKRAKISKKAFLANLRRCAAEVRTWPKWKRELFGSSDEGEG